MTDVRLPAVAGTFYPGDEEQLTSMIDAMLDVVPAPTDASAPIAIVVPHAGYVYSGPVAATAYQHLTPWSSTIDRVVVIGPAHRVPVPGLGLSSATAFATPLGLVPVDLEAVSTLLTHPGVVLSDETHFYEHSVEVQLPFLQRVLGRGWSLVPVVAGAGAPSTIANALEHLWGAEGTLFVISTDLSHYHDLATARRMDGATADDIVAVAWERIGGEQACGSIPLRGALALVRRRHEHVTLLDLRTSGDTAGPTDRVVGYGSFVIR